MAKFPAPVLRGSIYYLYRRVPTRYSQIDKRRFVEQSLHTDSETVAMSKAIVVWSQLVSGWEAMLAGNTSDAEARFDAARELANTRGFQYLPAQAVAGLPYGEFMKRLDVALGGTQKKTDALLAEAVLGGATEPPITVSRALELYWPLTKDKVLSKSEDQLRRWQNPRKKAVTNFIKVVGDKPLRDISGNDMLEFREWWMERLEIEELTPNSANKDLIHLGDVLKTVNRMKRLGLVLPLSDLSFKEGDVGKRPPFSTDWIRDVLIAPSALQGLNPEARAITLIMVNTGARPSEIAGLTQNTIHLDCAVPYISIEPEGRQLKTRRSQRKIPLVGISLDAIAPFPNGFGRYRESSATLSGTVNKFLRENNLVESPQHTMYSLRHSFEDRMIAGNIDDRIRRDLFGHRLSREQYGDGASLLQMRDLLQTIAL